MKAWLAAFRLRTLPLAFACIAMGSFLAGAEGKFSWLIFSLAILTTLFLQILSNLANDYGDTIHGADSDERLGPQRSVQSGAITLSAMKKAIIIFSLLSLVPGLALIYFGLQGVDNFFRIIFLCLGIGAIAAAIKYTAGKNPYGYKGLGDIFVFIFFGLVGVAGTYFLHTHTLSAGILLPAASIGLLSTGVLNVNNMRDHVSDKSTGKITLAVKLGPRYAKYYHLTLILLAIACIVTYTLMNYHAATQWIWVLSLPLFGLHLMKVLSNKEPVLLDKQLKFLVLSTLVFCLTFGIGLLVDG